MFKNRWLYITGGIILILLIFLFSLNRDRFLKSDEEKKSEIIIAIQNEDIRCIKRVY